MVSSVWLGMNGGNQRKGNDQLTNKEENNEICKERSAEHWEENVDMDT